MRKVSIYLSLISLFLFTSSFLFAQKKPTSGGAQLKIGVVDIKIIAESMPEAANAEKFLKDLEKKYNDSLIIMQDSYMKKLDQYQKGKNMMTPDAQQKEEESITILQGQILKFREDKFRELAQKRDEMLDPIRAKIRLAIKVVARDENINLVLDKGSDSVLFAEDKFDITYKVIDHIKRGG